MTKPKTKTLAEEVEAAEADETTEDQSPPPNPPNPMAHVRQQNTFGAKAVGLTFNPSGDASVNELKNLYAQIIDICHTKRQQLMGGSEAHRLWAIAITEAQSAQMWSVKAATWKD